MSSSKTGTSFEHAGRFWAASDAWWDGRRRAQDKAGGWGLEPRARLSGRERQPWFIDIRRQTLSRRAGGSGRSRDVQLEGDPFGPVEDLADLAPELARALDEELSKLAFKAWREWPVSSGLSKGMITLEFEVAGELFVATVASRAGYTLYIEGQPHRRLIDAPSRELVDRVAERAFRRTVED